ncbi:MAG: signal peptidase I [Desulfovibrio sp.]|jgi:signal peptidase I|uniref:signal peptidase I n=1 Tax=Desulfovibrio sp. TaxID=885 RepID=UPI00135EDC6A|nr:signal peptidase I [Desulfovibrio sp.]MTJ94081.1 signal peptidase I [Desulfovibrio sp.]
MAMLLQSQRPVKPLWREYGEALFVALILALVIRTFVVQAFKIPSESMVKTLLVGDHLLASKFSYGIKIPFTHTYIYKGEDPVKGDIIIFEYPNDPSVDYIKRIVGTPGDTIEVRNKQLFRNGEPVKESFIRFTEPDRIQPVRDNFGPVTVPADKYFVMGDNRDNSMDSRFWGFVDRSAIRAKAWRIYWSWGGLGDIRWDRIGKAVQ